MWIGQKLNLILLMIGSLMLILTKLSVLVQLVWGDIQAGFYGLVDKTRNIVHFCYTVFKHCVAFS